jgi:ribosomal protein L11 methyltransferase
MEWLEVSIETTTLGTEVLTGLTLSLGINGMVIDDPADLERYLADPRAARWDGVDEALLTGRDRGAQARVYLPNDKQGLARWAALRRGLARLRREDGAGRYGALAWTLATVREEDWANNWKAYFKPFTIGERLVVKPTWETWAGEDGRLILEIDPGSSFGTGQHHTTRLCLELLEKYSRPGQEVLDLGCGSGILFIAALLLGAKRAVGADIEENAGKTAADNALLNHLPQSRFAVYTGDVAADEALRRRLGWGGEWADLLLVNIVADVILALTPYLAGFLRPAGCLLVSGLIEDRAPEVLAALEGAGFSLIERRRGEDWHALALRRRQ